MSSTAPQGFRRTARLRRSLPGSSSRDPGLTNCPPDRGKVIQPVWHQGQNTLAILVGTASGCSW